MSKVEIPETRGRKRKYFFNEKLKVGDRQEFSGSITTISSCAKSWVSKNDLGWDIRCYTDPKTDKVILVRTK